MNNNTFANVVKSIDFFMKNLIEQPEERSDDFVNCFNDHLQTISFHEEELDDMVYVIFKNKFDSLTISKKIIVKQYIEKSIKTHIYYDTLIYKHLTKLREAF